MVDTISWDLHSDVSRHLAHSCHCSDSRRDVSEDLLDLIFVVSYEEDVIDIDYYYYNFSSVRVSFGEDAGIMDEAGVVKSVRISFTVLYHSSPACFSP